MIYRPSIRRFTMWLLLLIAAVLLPSGVVFAQEWEAPTSFSDAKLQMRYVYEPNPRTLYCDCEISWHGRRKSGGVPDHSSCGYEVRKQETRASRIEWEHVVPAWVFGHQRQCWKRNGTLSGRQNCRSQDGVFLLMEADMHNLAPAVGEINSDRSNFRFGMLPDTPAKHGQCDFRVAFQQRVAQPREEIRGFIARTYFYMHHRYQLNISRQQQRLLMAWDKQHPPDDWERQREERIANVIGTRNRFTTGELKWQLDKPPLEVP